MKSKFKYDDIIQSMYDIDCGCCYVGMGRFKKDSTIVMDNDDDGNCRWGYLELKVECDNVHVKSGHSLKKTEFKKWRFEDYDTVDEMVDKISDFTGVYFDSWVSARKHQIKKQ